jgi:hypothetical protein
MLAFEPSARVAFRSYQRLARELNETISGSKLGDLFMERYADITASLSKANAQEEMRLTEKDLVLSSSIVGDYCWPLKNETEAQVFSES